ncbi:hypothetical protein L6452_37351 [Arctium lappa]|uniref:Uncharacterized protein n=1 Tax=Arctium lappa TaxID=4217 RepID=A0ACB8Y3G9_ARCLA|nr:hypothetical protein L6452_37351 [Arctium lappa]
MSLAQPWTITNVTPSSTIHTSHSITTSIPDTSLVVDLPSDSSHPSFTPSISSPSSPMTTGLSPPTAASTPSPVSNIPEYVDGSLNQSTTSNSSSISPMQDTTPTHLHLLTLRSPILVHLNYPLFRLLRFPPCLLLWVLI